MADASDDLGIPMKPARPPGPGASAPVRTPTIPPRTPDLVRAADVARVPEVPRRPGEPGSQPRPSEAEVRKLIVEGSVEANLTNCRDVDIAESGLFKGSASIEEAEIRGRFEGNLVVRKRLLIKASGRISGTIRYGQIEIECGGQISGDIQAQPSSEPGEIMVDVPTARAAS